MHPVQPGSVKKMKRCSVRSVPLKDEMAKTIGAYETIRQNSVIGKHISMNPDRTKKES